MVFFSHKKYMKVLVESVENIEIWCKVEDEGLVFIGKKLDKIFFCIF